MMGLGSILGTGVFVSIAIAAGASGPSVVLAIAAAAAVAIFNGLSSAQLAAAYPFSGGTYEYGYRVLNPWLGFTAGWMFLWAKSASAATAALGMAGALSQLGNLQVRGWQVGIGVAAVVALTLLILSGIRRSNRTNMLIVSLTLTSLGAFVIWGLPSAWRAQSQTMTPFFWPVDGVTSPLHGFLQATALMFVAFTGYGRIATLAEEVRRPRQTIPLAVILTLLISMLLYGLVGYVGIAAIGADSFAETGTTGSAPLQVVAHQIGSPWLAWLLAVGGVTAMLGVSLNLLLGLSRVALAMARRRDIPAWFATVNEKRGSPDPATWLVAGLIVLLVLIGDVKTTWSFSAFTVLVYYAITNLAAIRLPAEQRLYHPLISWLGLGSCLGLAFWVDREVWISGLLLIGIGLIWHWIARRWGK
jgi:APA family basic amino acid/polyamine antiporter